MNFKIISWATEGDYKDILEYYLKPSLEKIEGIDSQFYFEKENRDWQKNTNLKPFIIEKALNETDKSVIVLDADSIVHSYPSLFDEIPVEYDCAFFYLNWNEWYGNGSSKKELCSGTLFFRNREICVDLIKEWQSECKRNRYPDQKNLEIALKKFEGIIKIYNLPYEYCWIHDLPNGKTPIIPRPEKVIIEHFQASRVMRTKIRNRK